MKCSNCGQEIIDKKEFCTNCGKKLQDTKASYNPKKYLIVIVILIIFAISLTSLIMNYGLDKELEPYLKDANSGIDNKNEKVKKYYGKYSIDTIITFDDTKEDIKRLKDKIMEYNIEFSSTKIVIGLYDDNLVSVNNPKIYIKENNEVENLFDDKDVSINLLIKGHSNNSNSLEEININYIVNNGKNYIYYNNALFELKTYKESNLDNNNETIKAYYGNYKIKEVIATKDTPIEIINAKEDFLGWNVLFSSDKILVGLNKLYWLNINSPRISIKENIEIEYLFNSNGSLSFIEVVGKNIHSVYRNPAIEFIINNEKFYAYYNNTLFELEKNNDIYKNTNVFYKINLLDSTTYSKEMNEVIENTKKFITSKIEGDLTLVLESHYDVYEDGNINHFVINNTYGYPNSSSNSLIVCINYNTKTLKMYNLEEYLQYKNIPFKTIKDKFNNIVSKLEENQMTKIDISKDSIYYVKDNKLYIKYGEITTNAIGSLFLDIDL